MAALHRTALPAPRTLVRVRPGRPLLLVLFLLMLGAALFQVNQFSHLTSTSYAIDALNRQRMAKQAENHQLEAQIAQLSSLGRVEWVARTQDHLAPAERVLYMSVNVPVPDRQTLPTRFLPPEHGAAVSGDAPLWKQILDLIPFF
jgi:cell division protein FtsL